MWLKITKFSENSLSSHSSFQPLIRFYRLPSMGLGSAPVPSARAKMLGSHVPRLNHHRGLCFLKNSPLHEFVHFTPSKKNKKNTFQSMCWNRPELLSGNFSQITLEYMQKAWIQILKNLVTGLRYSSFDSSPFLLFLYINRLVQESNYKTLINSLSQILSLMFDKGYRPSSDYTQGIDSFKQVYSGKVLRFSITLQCI